MGDYAPESSVGWLDFDETASEQVSTLLRSLEEPTTLDVLGLGTIRDAFSGIISPGTTTVQTRLRYFIFLPWIFNRLERERVAPSDFAHRLRYYEAQLIDCLRNLGPNQGVIGYTSGRELKRMPSEIYWGGLGAWGIRRLDLSLREYRKRASALGRVRYELDDDGVATRPLVPMWPAELQAPEDFLRKEETFDLTYDESSFLTDSIRRRHPDSLLAILCANPHQAEGVEFPWDLKSQALSPSLKSTLRHARCFSELTVGPQLVYNLLLARKAREDLQWETDELEADQRTRVSEWIELIDDRIDDLRSWVSTLPDFWNVLSDYRVGAATKDFVQEVVRRAVNDPIEFVNDPVVHARIREREVQLKKHQARLAHRVALENWNSAPVGGQLNYRWPITQRYLADMTAAQLIN